MKRKLYGQMMVNNLLTANAKIFWQQIILGQSGQIAILIGREDPFVDGMIISQMLNHIFDEFLMLDKVAAPQMKDACFVPVDQVMDLLGKPIIIRHIDDEVREHLNGFLVRYVFFDFLDSGGRITKNHGNT